MPLPSNKRSRAAARLRVAGLLDDADGALRDRLLLGEVLVAYLLGQLFRDGVGRHAHVHALTTHLFDEALRLHLEFFGEVVNPDLGSVGC